MKALPAESRFGLSLSGRSWTREVSGQLIIYVITWRGEALGLDISMRMVWTRAELTRMHNPRTRLAKALWLVRASLRREMTRPGRATPQPAAMLAGV